VGAGAWREGLLTGALAVGLAGVGFSWWAVDQAWPDPDAVCTERPMACQGRRVVLPLQRVRARTEGGVVVGRGDDRIEVVGPRVAPLAPGQEVSVGGTIDSRGRLQPDLVQVHPGRPGKWWLGLLGAGVVLILVPAAFTLRRTPHGWRVVARG
jgi:hypothetical protein